MRKSPKANTSPKPGKPGDKLQIDHQSFPAFHDLTELLSFRPEEGRIWLQDTRMILLHAEAFASLRQELIEAVGVENARGILTRIGYIAGSKDAEIAWKVRGTSDSPFDLWIAGSQFHSLEGIVLTEPIRGEVDSSSGHCYLEFLWKNSVEDEAHIKAYGVTSEPTCWMEIGYASGFLSSCMGKRILVREVECRSTGFSQCRAIAKPVSEWDNPEEDLKYLDARLMDRGNKAPPPVLHPLALPAYAERGSQEPRGNNDTIGASASFNAAMHKVQRVAPTRASVLFLGESGVGKSRFASEVHRSSPRAALPFIEVNCAAIPEQLIESELFGVERGAYSGAMESRAGRFEIADKGTLFLDEVATLSLTAQGKLLRVLQTGEMERLGSTKTLRVDVRLVAATNENLQKAVKEGRFREDLFYRLNVFPISIPPLRERKDDLPILLEYCIGKFSRQHGRHITGVTPRALQAILGYSWPGNIRELENVIERSIILADDNTSLDIHHLFSVDGSFETADQMGLSNMGTLIPKKITVDSNKDASTLEGTLDEWATAFIRKNAATFADVEEALVRAAVSEAQGNISKAASLLKITRHQLDYRVKKLPF